MYGLVAIWKSMDDGPYWVILLMYGSHEMRNAGFYRLMMVNRTLLFWGVTNQNTYRSMRDNRNPPRMSVPACKVPPTSTPYGNA